MSQLLPKNKPLLPKWGWNLWPEEVAGNAVYSVSCQAWAEFLEAANKCPYQATESKGLGINSVLDFNVSLPDLCT